MIKKIFKSIFRKKNIQSDKDLIYRIGDISVILPNSHKLPEYQQSFQNYDKKLKNIINELKLKYSGIIIDIGANIGDTAVYIRSFSQIPIICVEGDLFYLNYLQRNLEKFSDIVICPFFVKGRGEDGSFQINRSDGTARLESLTDKVQSVDNFITLSEILEQNDLKSENLMLIKIDTDGFDFDIILANEEIIKRKQPNIYFEYDIHFNSADIDDSICVIELLSELGYGFVVYDNFGNLLTLVEQNCKEEFIMLNHYLKSCRKYGGGVYYFDILATTDKVIRRNILANDL